jgi:phage-related protein (TIGR01555 family)
MLRRFILKWLDIKPEVTHTPEVFSTDPHPKRKNENIRLKLERALAQTFQKPLPAQHQPNIGMDDAGQPLSVKALYQLNSFTIATAQFLWYASQGFIGYQTCAMLSQHWLIMKACLMPAKDAVRQGYEVTINDGTEVKPEVLDEIRKLDDEYRLTDNMVAFVQKGKIFGIRVAMFKVRSSDPEYYTKPFNPDGVEPNSYIGIAQIDPYWIIPQLTSANTSDPGSIDYYEPTYWNVNGVNVHKTHLVIYRTEELPDILKPTYLYGGVSIPQKIYERVYASERIANEAPMLALSKRTKIYKLDAAAALANPANVLQKIEEAAAYANNYGIQLIDKESEDIAQFDTALADLDEAIMTQYQLVSAIANVPSVKLLGTSPKGFNTTGEFEESNYHEELQSIQKHDLTRLANRHHLLVIRSAIVPKFNIQPFSTTVMWKPLDAMTAKEQAELNKYNAETGQILATSGAIDGQDERARIIADPNSGYSGISDEAVDSDEGEVIYDPNEEETEVVSEA